MSAASYDDVRRLAVWMARRREVDEMLAVLTQYGPTAHDRVATHLDALRAMLAAEQEAFDRYAAGAGGRPQKPLPTVLPEQDDDSNVHSLLVARLGRTAQPGS